MSQRHYMNTNMTRGSPELISYIVISLGDRHEDCVVCINAPEHMIQCFMSADEALSVNFRSRQNDTWSFNVKVDQKLETEPLLCLPTKEHRNAVHVVLKTHVCGHFQTVKLITSSENIILAEMGHLFIHVIHNMGKQNENVSSFMLSAAEKPGMKLAQHVYIGIGSITSQRNGRNLAANAKMIADGFRSISKLYYDPEEGSVRGVSLFPTHSYCPHYHYWSLIINNTNSCPCENLVQLMSFESLESVKDLLSNENCMQLTKEGILKRSSDFIHILASDKIVMPKWALGNLMRPLDLYKSTSAIIIPDPRPTSHTASRVRPTMSEGAFPKPITCLRTSPRNAVFGNSSVSRKLFDEPFLPKNEHDRFLECTHGDSHRLSAHNKITKQDIPESKWDERFFTSCVSSMKNRAIIIEVGASSGRNNKESLGSSDSSTIVPYVDRIYINHKWRGSNSDNSYELDQLEEPDEFMARIANMIRDKRSMCGSHQSNTITYGGGDVETQQENFRSDRSWNSMKDNDPADGVDERVRRGSKFEGDWGERVSGVSEDVAGVSDRIHNEQLDDSDMFESLERLLDEMGLDAILNENGSANEIHGASEEKEESSDPPN